MPPAHLLSRGRPSAATLQCNRCSLHLPKSAFSNCQVRRATRRCLECGLAATRAQPSAATILTCSQCLQELPPNAFSEMQRPRSTRRCKDCLCRPAATAAMVSCSVCCIVFPVEEFAVDQRRPGGICRGCTQNGRPSHGDACIRLGSMSRVCKHCGAHLFPTEHTGMCCNHGKYAIGFENFFRLPCDALIRLYSNSWPYLDARGHLVHDATCNGPKLTGFSACSRRFNHLFCLAQHEVQSSTSVKEMRFGNELRPSNIRIHGTMCRRVFSC